MGHLTWINSSPLNPTNLNNLVQEGSLQPETSTFNGQDGRTLTHDYGHPDYQATINPTADCQNFLGEIWMNKSANTVVIYNSGSHRGAFDYVIIPHA